MCGSQEKHRQNVKRGQCELAAANLKRWADDMASGCQFAMAGVPRPPPPTLPGAIVWRAPRGSDVRQRSPAPLYALQPTDVSGLGCGCSWQKRNL